MAYIVLMKKKSERYSFKKLTAFAKKPELRLLEDLKLSNDRQARSHSKHKSSERILSAYETNHRFKVNKEKERARIKTEADEAARNKTPMHKLTTKRQRDRSGRVTEKSKFIETKHLNLKKLNLNEGLNRSGLRGQDHHSLEKVDTPHSGKHYSFRKAHQSHRAGLKKTALEKYVSESLENLELANKKKAYSSSRHNDLKSTVKKQQNDPASFKGVVKARSREKPEIREEVSPKRGESGRKHTQEREESLEKIELKWEKKRKNPYDMSREEWEVFGDRFPDGFNKLKLLGRGGFSLVWLGEHAKSKKKYAIKQIITESSHQTHIKEIWFGTYFFQFGGAPKPQFAKSPGIAHLVKLYYYFINKKDTWILYEKCGDSLGNALYELKSEHYNGQKMYRIHYRDFYLYLRRNQDELRRIILHIARALELLAQNNIVHSDLKTQNVLVRLRNEEELKESSQAGESQILETKLIDYGSSFVFNNLRQFSMATPEYMAPQILNFILYENEFEYIPKLLEYVQKYHHPWVIDVWSLGSVLLEIVSGIPLWMSLKTIVRRRSAEAIRYGLFAIKGRAFDKIIKQQLEVIQNLDHYLFEENYSGIVLEEDLVVLLKRMLALNPAKRISPTEIIAYLEKSLDK